MGSLTGAILMACVGVNGSYQPACNSAVQAGSIQSGLAHELDQVEVNIRQTAENKLGKRAITAVSYTYIVYEAGRSKSIQFKLPTFGVCDSITNRVSTRSYDLNMGWRF